MTVTINGERREIPDGLNVATLLDYVGMARDRVAIERNFEILPRAQWEQTAVQPNDNFEIVHFVGGGQESPHENCKIPAFIYKLASRWPSLLCLVRR